MKPIYIMLSIAGWVWLAALVGYVAWMNRRRARRGLDVVAEAERREKELEP